MILFIRLTFFTHLLRKFIKRFKFIFIKKIIRSYFKYLRGKINFKYILIAILAGLFIIFLLNFEPGFGERQIMKSDEYLIVPAKTVWDILEVVLLPLTVALAVTVWLYHKKELADSNHRKRLVSDYQKEMTELIVNKDLLRSPSGSGVQAAAHIKTLVTLRQLKGPEKLIIFQFLVKSGLINNREEQPPILSLEEADLSGITFEDGLHVENINLGGANLGKLIADKGIFKHVDFTNCNLEGSSLEEAEIYGCELKGACLERAYLEDALLYFSNFEGTRMARSNLTRARLTNTNLTDVDFTKTRVKNADFTDAVIDNTNFRKSNGLKSEQLKYATYINKKPMLPDKVELPEFGFMTE